MYTDSFSGSTVFSGLFSSGAASCPPFACHSIHAIKEHIINDIARFRRPSRLSGPWLRYSPPVSCGRDRNHPDYLGALTNLSMRTTTPSPVDKPVSRARAPRAILTWKLFISPWQSFQTAGHPGPPATDPRFRPCRTPAADDWPDL